MTAAFPLQTGISPRIFVRCILLSLMLHTGMLAGLSLIERSDPIIETVPLVNVTLVPPEIATETQDPREPTESTTPPMKTATRLSTSLPTPSPTRNIVSQPSQIKKASALELTASPPLLETPISPPKKRILKDTLASDALFAQSAIKMVKRPTASSRTSIPDPTIPNMRVTKNHTLPTLQVTEQFNTVSTLPLSQRKRRLTTSPPGTSSSQAAKIGVRHSVPPVYPRIAKEEGWEGIVLVRVLVQTSGLPGQITIQKSSGHEILDEAAIEAIRQWRFTPAMDGNFPIKKYLQIPLNFGLHR